MSRIKVLLFMHCKEDPKENLKKSCFRKHVSLKWLSILVRPFTMFQLLGLLMSCDYLTSHRSAKRKFASFLYKAVQCIAEPANKRRQDSSVVEYLPKD